jgi:hypothetical protein
MMLAIAAFLLLAVFLRETRTGISPLGGKDLERHRRASEEQCRQWMYPFN